MPLTQGKTRCCRHEMKPCNHLSGRETGPSPEVLVDACSPSNPPHLLSHLIRPSPIIQDLLLVARLCGCRFGNISLSNSPEKHDGTILRRLEACDTPVDVQPGGPVTLEPEHHTRAVSLQLRKGEHCFMLMGTSPGSAIIMAKIAAFETSGLEAVEGQSTIVPTDVDYMASVRNVIGAYLKRPEMFYTPIGWLFSSDLDDPWRTYH